jgi:hypothetical protein
MRFWIFKKRSNLKHGLTREELQREIDYYRKLLDKNGHTPQGIKQVKFMLMKYENWMANFENLDLNKDGRLDLEETKE